MDLTPAAAAVSAALAPNEMLVTVRFAEVDLMGVVHHSRYWPWMEEARFHFLLTVLDVTPDEVLREEVYMPLVSSSCKYARAARWGDRLIVAVHMEADRGARVVFRHEVRDSADGARVASAVSTHVFTDLQMGLKLAFPSFYRDKLRAALTGPCAAYIHAPAWTSPTATEVPC